MAEHRDTDHLSDELLDELDATIIMLGRLMAARHAEHCGGAEVGASVTGPRVLALRVISEVGASRVGDLASYLGIKAPAMTSLVDALERDGLVRREHDTDDRRVTRVEITEGGRTALHVAEQHRRRHLRDYLGVLDEDDIRSLIRIQRTLIESMIEQDGKHGDGMKGSL